MAFEVRDMTGSMFRNTRKESPNHPDYTGSGKIDGRDAWINCWEKQDKKGDTYYSFAFKWKDGTSARPGRGGADDQPVQEFVKKVEQAFPGAKVSVAGPFGIDEPDVPF